MSEFGKVWLMTDKYAVVNKETEIVENIIMCSENDTLEGYYLVPMPQPFYSYNGLYKMISKIQINETKWNPEKGYHSSNPDDDNLIFTRV
jgi:hypothetical protein